MTYQMWAEKCFGTNTVWPIKCPQESLIIGYKKSMTCQQVSSQVQLVGTNHLWNVWKLTRICWITIATNMGQEKAKLIITSCLKFCIVYFKLLSTLIQRYKIQRGFIETLRYSFCQHHNRNDLGLCHIVKHSIMVLLTLSRQYFYYRTWQRQ